MTDAHRAALAVLANPATPVAVLTATLLDARHDWEVFQQADSDDDGGSGDASDCIAGCDQLFEDCLESWGEAVGEEDIDIFDAEDEEQADDGSGSVDLEDNPFDVENEDTSDTGGEDDSDDTRDEGGLTTFEAGAVIGFCSVQYTACIAGCLISGAFG